MRARFLLLLFIAVFAIGCQADVVVKVDVADDGDGSVAVQVVLDADAWDRVEGDTDLRTEDLTLAGWSVAEPEPTDDGGMVLRSSKPFADPAGLHRVLEEVSGPEGPFAQLGLRVDRPFGRTEFRFDGVLDGSVGVDAFADPQVAAALDGLAFGQDPAVLEDELGAPLGSMVNLGLIVSLPGEEPAEWNTDLTATDPVPVLAESDIWRMQPLVLAGLAAFLAVVLLVLLLLGVVAAVRRRRRRRQRAREAPADIPADEPEPAPPAPVAAALGERDPTSEPETAVVATGESPGLELVVLGGPGTVFGMHDEVDELVAFARAHGSRLEYPKIADRYGAASRGQLSTAELWDELGVAGDPTELDADLLGRYQLTPGLREFVIRARESGYQVAYLGDGPAAWARDLRRTFMLDDLIEPWVLSSDIGATLPDRALFEALRRITRVEPASCLLIDDRLRVLEAASELGFGTTWFTPRGRATEAPGHSILRSFTDLLSP